MQLGILNGRIGGGRDPLLQTRKYFSRSGNIPLDENAVLDSILP
jgi:hypothetical protein